MPPWSTFTPTLSNRPRRANIVAPALLLAIIGCTQSPTSDLGHIAIATAHEPPAAAPRKDDDAARDAQIRMTALTARHVRRILSSAPEWASRLGVDETVAGEGFERRLSSYSPAANAAQRSLPQELRAELNDIDRALLTGTDADTWDVLESTYAFAARQNALGIGTASLLGLSPPYAVNPLFSPQINLPRLFASELVVSSTDDVESFLARLAELPGAIGGVADQVEEDSKAGVTPPAFILNAVAASARRLTASEASQHPICEALGQQTRANRTLSVLSHESVERCTALLTEAVFPAFQQFADRMDGLAASASNHAGIWQQSAGTELYQIALAYYGAGDLDAEGIHELGLKEVARIEDEMDQILRELGLAEGSIVSRVTELSNRPEHQIPDTEQARELLLQELRGFVDTVLEVSEPWFDGVPHQPIEVRRIPEYEQDAAAGAYYTMPSIDGTRPGTFWINLKETSDWTRFALKTLVVHEAIPGHHFQASVQLDEGDLPLIRNMMFFSDTGEGWALYAEALAEEMGLYKDDPASNLGRLRAELYRAARLVVDTGLHHKRWSRHQAIDWMVSITGETESSIAREVDRYAAWPGQAVSYKLGMIRIQQLRAHAEQALGVHFDVASFHSEILRAGSMPLAVLERRVQRWIESQLVGVADRASIEL